MESSFITTTSIIHLYAVRFTHLSTRDDWLSYEIRYKVKYSLDHGNDMRTTKCDPRNVSASVGRNSGPIFRRLWTKVHQIKRSCAGEIAVCNAVFRSTIPCFVPERFGISCDVVRNLIVSRCYIVYRGVARNLFWGGIKSSITVLTSLLPHKVYLA